MTEKKSIKIHTEIVNGICPTCEEYTMLVGVTKSFYRCMSCGADLEQYVNGCIIYIHSQLAECKIQIKIKNFNRTFKHSIALRAIEIQMKT